MSNIKSDIKAKVNEAENKMHELKGRAEQKKQDVEKKKKKKK